MDEDIYIPVTKTNICESGWKPKRVIGRGQYGQVHNICCADNCNYVAKLQMACDDFTLKGILKELKYQNIFAKDDITIPIIDHFLYYPNEEIQSQLGLSCKRFMVFIMPSLKMTLDKLVAQYYFSDMDIKDIINVIAKYIVDALQKYQLIIEKYKLSHDDAHPDNIMISQDNKVYLIDFGHVQKIYTQQDIDDTVTTILERLFDLDYDRNLYMSILPSFDYQVTDDIMRFNNMLIKQVLKKLKSNSIFKEQLESTSEKYFL